MPAFIQSVARNRILTLIPPDHLSEFVSRFEYFSLPVRRVLFEPSQQADHVYFPEAGVVSRIVCSPSGDQVECGMTGSEGMVPAEAALEIDVVGDRLIMQLGGSGWRLRRDFYTALLDRSGVFRTLTKHFIAVMMIQMRHTAVSNVVNPVETRLARWLTMCADRIEGDTVDTTQEFISIMLAVRRPSVTDALHALERHGLLAVERGRLRIIDRVGLEQAAGQYYGEPEQLYRRLIGPMARDERAPGPPKPAWSRFVGGPEPLW